MTISVRLPPRVEQKLAEYCVSHKVTRSEAVKQALDRLFETGTEKPSPWEIGADIFARHESVKPTEDIARHSKRLLRERFRGTSKRRGSTRTRALSPRYFLPHTRSLPPPSPT